MKLERSHRRSLIARFLDGIGRIERQGCPFMVRPERKFAAATAISVTTGFTFHSENNLSWRRLKNTAPAPRLCG